MPKTKKRSEWTVILVMTGVVLAGCGRNSSGKPAPIQLQESFKKAAAPVQREVVQATAAFETGNYTQAILIMNRLVQNQPVDKAQKQALDALIVQTRQAVHQDPKRDGPQLYKAMADLTFRLHGEN